MSLSSDIRRRLLKRAYLSGAISTKQSSTNNITIDEYTLMGPLNYLELVGNARAKDTPNLMEKYRGYFMNIDNYLEVEYPAYYYIIPFPEEWLNKELTFSLVEKIKMTGILVWLCDDPGLSAHSEILLDSRGNLYEVTSSAYSYFRFTGVLPEDKDKLIQFWQKYEVYIKGSLRDYPGLELSSDVPMKIKIQGQEAGQLAEVQLPYNLIIPEGDGNKNIPFRMSQWDKLIISYNPKRVMYEQGSQLVTVIPGWIKWSNEYTFLTFYHSLGDDCLPDEGLCSHFPVGKRVDPDLINNDNMVVIGDPNFSTSAVYRYDQAQTVEDFKTWVGTQIDLGTPVTCLGHKRYPEQYDITDTELGQQLLNLKLYPGYSSITVESDLPISSMTCKYYSYEEWDDYRLTVKYQDQEGNTIRGTDYYAVRAGSVYEITHKYISGYTCITPDIKGIMTTDKEVTFEYIKS